jgi:hypothetical protein
MFASLVHVAILTGFVTDKPSKHKEVANTLKGIALCAFGGISWTKAARKARKLALVNR